MARPVRIDIPSGDLGAALVALSRQSGLSVGIAGLLPQHKTRAIKATIEPSAALERLLRGSGLKAVGTASGLWRLEPIVRDRPKGDVAPLVIGGEEIVVTGTKRDETLAGIPIAISIIRPGIADRLTGGRGVHDAIATAEGAFATNLGPGRDRIFLRGVADSAFNGPTQSTVSLYLDDARVSYATPDPDLRLVDIDHVELLRGPQGTLYGTGALGGIVRIVPGKPDLVDWSGQVAIEGNRVSHGGVGGAGEAMINAPIISGRLGLRAVGYVERSGGWVDDSGRGDRDVNSVRRYGGRVSLRWRFAEDWTADVGLVTQWINAADSQYATRGLTRNTGLAEPHDNDFLAATATIKGIIRDLDFVSTSAFVTHEVGSVYDAGAAASARGLSLPLGFSDERELTLKTQEWRLSDPSAGRPWVAGVAVLSAENRSRGSFMPLSGPEISVLSLQNDAFEAAIFGEASQPVTGSVTATVGLRAFVSRVDNEQSGQARRRARKSGLSPSGTLSWKGADGTLVWLRYANAIRPGGINPSGDPGLKDFQSDNLKSIELGWRLKAWDRLRLNGSLFGLRWANVQSDSIGLDGLVRTINAGNADNIGLELASTLDLYPLTIEGNVTVQHARLSRPSSAANAIGDDNRLPVLPDHAGRMKIGWDHPVGDVDANWFVAGRYVGKARLSFDPGIARSMGGYWTADAGVVLSRGGWRAALTIANLFDGRGDSFGFGNPFSFRSIDQRTPIQPRTFGIRLERKY